MKELTEMAAQYAAGKANELLTNVIAKAYADGYRDGYNDKEDEISVELGDDSETEYVDLGLPSGTLWSADYEVEDGYVVYLPHEKASRYSLPTESQWEELKETCRWEFEYDDSYELTIAKCVGPNGNFLKFECTGMKEVDSKSLFSDMFFWLVDTREQTEKNAVRMHNAGKGNTPMRYRGEAYVGCFFSGYKLPIRLVRTK